MPGRNNPGMCSDALTLLRTDHSRLQQWFDRFQNAGTLQEEEEIAGEIVDEVRLHSELDRTVFYPAIGEADSYRITKSLSDHDELDGLLDEIERAGPTEDAFFAKMHLLCEMFQEHVRDEEKPQGIFALAQQASVDLEALGGELERRRSLLQRQPAPAV